MKNFIKKILEIILNIISCYINYYRTMINDIEIKLNNKKFPVFIFTNNEIDKLIEYNLSIDSSKERKKYLYNKKILLLNMIRDTIINNYSIEEIDMVVELYNRLIKLKCLIYLTGEDDEWELVSDNLYRNKRHYSVYKDNNNAYDIHGCLLIDKNTNYKFYDKKYSVIKIDKFPYYPIEKIMYVDKNNYNNDVNITYEQESHVIH